MSVLHPVGSAHGRNGFHRLPDDEPEAFPHFINHVLFGTEKTVSGIVGPLEDAEEGVSGVEENVSGFRWGGIRKRVLHGLELDAILERIFVVFHV